MSAIVSIALKETFLPDFPAEKPINPESNLYGCSSPIWICTGLTRRSQACFIPTCIHKYQYLTVADPDLEIKGGPGHSVPEIRCGPSLKKIFSALWVSVWSKNKGGGASPVSATVLFDPFIIIF